MNSAKTIELLSVDGKPLKLDMQQLHLRGELLPFGARLFVRHVFRVGGNKSVEAIYAFPMPREAALRSFRVSGPGFEAISDLKERKEAERDYEKGIERGNLSVLASLYRDGVVNLNVGNLRPGEETTVLLEIIAGVEMRDDGFRFRFPFTLPPVYHPQAIFTEYRPSIGETQLPEEVFGDVILPPVHRDASMLHGVSVELLVDASLGVCECKSPSHPIAVNFEDPKVIRIGFANGAELPNGDIILDIKYKEATSPRLFVGSIKAKNSPKDQAAQHAFAALLPSSLFSGKTTPPSRFVFVVDRSGSMGVVPMKQATGAVKACLSLLNKDDQFNIIAFDSSCEVFSDKLFPAGNEERNSANQFVEAIKARGGTELLPALQQAVSMLGEQGGDIFLVTDGQIGETEPIVRMVSQFGLRLHVLGIVDASQERFLAALASATGGISRCLGTRERIDHAALDMFAGIHHPLAEGFEALIKGDSDATISPAPRRMVYPDVPAVILGSLSDPTAAELALNWKGGSLDLPLGKESAKCNLADTLHLLRGAKLIADLEAQLDCPPGNAAKKRESKRLETQLLTLSSEYGLATRLNSLVAVVKRTGDRPGNLPETRVIPVGMPSATDFDVYARQDVRFATVCQSIGTVRQSRIVSESIRSKPCLSSPCFFEKPLEAPKSLSTADKAEVATKIAGMLQSDGGMPGRTDEFRLSNSLGALACLIVCGNTSVSGPFRVHVKRLIQYLESADWGPVPKMYAVDVRTLFESLQAGRSPKNTWIELARWLDKPRQAWELMMPEILF